MKICPNHIHFFVNGMSEGIITPLINSERYHAAINEIADAIKGSIESIPFVEPQLCTFLDDNVATQLLEKETKNNDQLMDELTELYHDIIEDTLLAEFEIQPLEEKREELWRSFTKSSFAKLIEKYDTSAREEAALVVKYRNEMNEIDTQLPTLQTAAYDVESTNRRLRKEIKALNNQLKFTEEDLRKENAEKIIDTSELDSVSERCERAKSHLEKLLKSVEESERKRDELADECQELQADIDSMMEQLVAMDKRSAARTKPKRTLRS